MRRTFKTLATLGALVFFCIGCGHKLPPMPPGMSDPVEIVSARFEGEDVTVKARCSMRSGSLILLGKAKGICPACTDDLQEKDELLITEPGVIFLRDKNPEAPYMVYRVAYKKETTVWMTPLAIVLQ
ncbi:MAG TPA: hypothetical protein ENN05_11995 [Deltaproteobacteria bacterium]|nr:hypothetical protein [Deltaproteobacteria bacterium]